MPDPRSAEPGPNAAADDHLMDLLLHGASSGGEGAFNNYDTWWASLRGPSADAAPARLVTAHEAMHVALNDCTAFGTALAAAGLLAQELRRPHMLRRLVGMCREAHEAFATYQSLWLVSDGDLGLLDGRPAYLSWYRDAAELVPLPDHSRRKEMAIDAVARSSMQSPVLAELLETGFDAPHASVIRAHRPNVRFGWIHADAHDEFWRRCWQLCADATHHLPGWDLLLACDEDPALRARTYDDDLSPTWEVIAEVLHAELASLLRRRGARTLGYDEHRIFTADVIAAVEALAPGARGRLIVSAEGASPQLESFEMWSRERLVVRDRPRPAVLHRIEDLRDGAQVTLVSEHSSRRHVFCVVRPAFRLLQQFEFSPANQALLGELYSQPVAAVQSSGAATEPVDLVVLSRPAHLDALADAEPGELGVLTNIALSCLANESWRDQWSDSLTRTSVTGLIDLSPMRQFDAWRDNGDDLRYALGAISGGDHGAALFACTVGDSNLPLLLPCTSITQDVLGQYLAMQFPAAVRTPATLQDVQDIVEVTLSHLLGTEHFFDVAAYPRTFGTELIHE